MATAIKVILAGLLILSISACVNWHHLGDYRGRALPGSGAGGTVVPGNLPLAASAIIASPRFFCRGHGLNFYLHLAGYMDGGPLDIVFVELQVDDGEVYTGRWDLSVTNGITSAESSVSMPDLKRVFQEMLVGGVVRIRVTDSDDEERQEGTWRLPGFGRAIKRLACYDEFAVELEARI